MSARMAFWGPAGAVTSMSKDQAFAELETYFKSNPNALDYTTLSENPKLKQAVEVLFNGGKPIQSQDDYEKCAKPVNAELKIYLMSFTGPSTKPLTTISQRTFAELNKPENSEIKKRYVGGGSPVNTLAARRDAVAAVAVAIEAIPRNDAVIDRSVAPVLAAAGDETVADPVAVWRSRLTVLENSDAYKKYYNSPSVIYEKDDPLQSMQRELAKKSPNSAQLEEFYQAALTRTYYGAVADHYLKTYSIKDKVKFNFAAENIYNVESAIGVLYAPNASLAVLNEQITNLSKLELQTSGKKTSPLIPLLVEYNRLESEGFDLKTTPVPVTDGKKEVAQFKRDLEFLRRQYEDTVARTESVARTRVIDSLDLLYNTLYNNGLVGETVLAEKSIEPKAIDARVNRIRITSAASEFEPIFSRTNTAASVFNEQRTKKAGSNVPLTPEYTAFADALLAIQSDLEKGLTTTKEGLGKDLAEARTVIDKVTERGELLARAEAIAKDIAKINGSERVNLPALKPAIAQLKADAQTLLDSQEIAVVSAQDAARAAIDKYKRAYTDLSPATQMTLSAFGVATFKRLDRNFENVEKGDTTYQEVENDAKATLERLRTALQPASVKDRSEAEYLFAMGRFEALKQQSPELVTPGLNDDAESLKSLHGDAKTDEQYQRVLRRAQELKQECVNLLGPSKEGTAIPNKLYLNADLQNVIVGEYPKANVTISTKNDDWLPVVFAQSPFSINYYVVRTVTREKTAYAGATPTVSSEMYLVKPSQGQGPETLAHLKPTKNPGEFEIEVRTDNSGALIDFMTGKTTPQVVGSATRDANGAFTFDLEKGFTARKMLRGEVLHTALQDRIGGLEPEATSFSLVLSAGVKARPKTEDRDPLGGTRIFVTESFQFVPVREVVDTKK